MHLNKTAL